MSVKYVDSKQTSRAEAFELWMGAPNPMVTFVKTLDITPLVRLSRRRGKKFNGVSVTPQARSRSFIHCLLTASCADMMAWL